MKIICFFTLLILSVNAFAQSDYNVRYYRTRSGSLIPVVQKNAPKEKQISGVGLEMKGVASLSNNKATVYIRSCGNVELNGLIDKDATGKEIPSKKAEKLKSGSRIILRMASIGSCSVADWSYDE